MQDHEHRITRLSARLNQLFETKTPFRIYHGSTNATKILEFERDKMIDVSDFDHILSIDYERRTIVVEPNVPMDKLLQTTLKHNLMPPVVMEFPGITVGGGIQGGAGESSSFKYGCFNRTANWIEILLPNGERVRCSPSHRADLFYGQAGSLGTIGVITAIELSLIPATKYVRLTYLPVHSYNDMLTTLKKENHRSTTDYLDAIMFSPTRGIIMRGELKDTQLSDHARFSRAHDTWFYLHAEAINASHLSERFTESIPLTDYLFRYDRGAFWVGKYAFEIFGIPFSALTRFLLNPILHTRKLYQALQESGQSQLHIVQDMAMPMAQAQHFMEDVERRFNTFPLWLCPMKRDDDSQFLANYLTENDIVSIGLWGSSLETHQRFIAANRELEDMLSSRGGKKWFYAHAYYSEQDFWHLYDKTSYVELRRVAHATHLPSIYEKATVHKLFKISTRRGLWRTIFGRARLRIR